MNDCHYYRCYDSSFKLPKGHMKTAQSCLEKFECFVATERLDYWTKYGSVVIKERKRYGSDGVSDSDITDDEESTGICFPGRTLFRPGIYFEGKETHNCSKRCAVSERHSPGIRTNQCACENRKVIGFAVMTKAESTALALSACFSQFQFPPRVILYDNFCNLFA